MAVNNSGLLNSVEISSTLAKQRRAEERTTHRVPRCEEARRVLPLRQKRGKRAVCGSSIKMSPLLDCIRFSVLVICRVVSLSYR